VGNNAQTDPGDGKGNFFHAAGRTAAGS